MSKKNIAIVIQKAKNMQTNKQSFLRVFAY